VTGGIGSGKSLVCSFFQKLGAPVLSADDIAKDLMTNDSGLRKALARLLGPEAYLADGSLNRKFIAERIFSAPALQKKVNALVHPKVAREIDRRMKALNGLTPYVIVEAALIYEAGLDAMLDSVVVVDAETEVRIQRVQERDRSSREDVEKRTEAQWSNKRKVQRADYVLRNNGSIHELGQNVRFLHTLFTTTARQEQE
jgi:dephospho-CoA kinase